MKVFCISLLFGILMPIVACGENKLFINEEKDVGNIYLLNIKERNINKQCLMEKVRLIISYIDNQQIAPYLVIIWKEDSLVKETLKQETIKIERELSKSDILIPIKYKGRRIILFKNEDYRMWGIVSEKPKVDFYECFR